MLPRRRRLTRPQQHKEPAELEPYGMVPLRYNPQCQRYGTNGGVVVELLRRTRYSGENGGALRTSRSLYRHNQTAFKRQEPGI